MEKSVPGTVGDYAANIGTTGFDKTVPITLSNVTTELVPNGVFIVARGRRILDIKDGTSNTLLVGEKHVPDNMMATYPYDCNLYDGHNIVCSTRSAGPGFPLATSPLDQRLVFGGPHIGICQFVFCDGSVKPINTSISEQMLGRLSHRNDGLPAPTDY